MIKQEEMRRRHCLFSSALFYVNPLLFLLAHLGFVGINHGKRAGRRFAAARWHDGLGTVSDLYFGRVFCDLFLERS